MLPIRQATLVGLGLSASVLGAILPTVQNDPNYCIVGHTTCNEDYVYHCDSNNKWMAKEKCVYPSWCNAEADGTVVSITDLIISLIWISLNQNSIIKRGWINASKILLGPFCVFSKKQLLTLVVEGMCIGHRIEAQHPGGLICSHFDSDSYQWILSLSYQL